MLGFEGMRVLEACEVDDELELLVETAAERDWCQRCGVRARSHERPETLVRDVDAFVGVSAFPFSRRPSAVGRWGRKPLIETDPGLVEALEALVSKFR